MMGEPVRNELAIPSPPLPPVPFPPLPVPFPPTCVAPPPPPPPPLAASALALPPAFPYAVMFTPFEEVPGAVV